MLFTRGRKGPSSRPLGNLWTFWNVELLDVSNLTMESLSLTKKRMIPSSTIPPIYTKLPYVPESSVCTKGKDQICFCGVQLFAYIFI